MIIKTEGGTMHNHIITAVIIESHQLFCEGLKQIIESEPAFKVIGKGVDKQDTLRLVTRYQPNVLILDEKILGTDPEKEIKEIINISSNTKILLLSDTSSDADLLVFTLQCGAHGYIVKEMNDELFLKAMKSVSRGRFWLHPDISHSLVKEYKKLRDSLEGTVIRQRSAQLPLHLFTFRECEVLELLVIGKTNQDIADFLGVTESTVKNHVRNILGKMKVQDRTNAVITALQNNWVDLSSYPERSIN